MIAYIEGRLLEKTEQSCILVTNGGVGYELFIPTYFFARLPQLGENCFFYAATIVREDALELYGFETWDERETFLLLISINRIGPRTGLGILSVFRPDDLRRIVLNEEVLLLTRVPGIGKKTAQQLFLELKYKLKLVGLGIPEETGAKHTGVRNDALAGLVQLGYDESEALKAIQEVLRKDANLDLGGILRNALKRLGQGR